MWWKESRNGGRSLITGARTSAENRHSPQCARRAAELHVYFLASLDIGSNWTQPDIAKGIETRAGNGYVVAPLSRTERASDPQVKADGQYELLRGDIDTAPTPLVAHCTRVNKTSPIVARTLSLAVDGYPLDRVERQFVQARVNSAFDMLRRATVGCRNKTLFRASVMIGAFVADGAIDPQLADALLTEAATEIGLDASEIAKTIHSGFKRGAQDSTALGGNPAIAFEHVHLLPPPQQTENAGGSASPAGSQFADDGIRLRWHGDDDDAPLKEWLVERMLPKSGRALIAGQWGSYKTFVAFDLAGSVITKTPFAGRNVNRQGGVLWLAAEGQDEVRLRLAGLVNAKLKPAIEAGTEAPLDPDHLPFVWGDSSPVLSSPRAKEELRAIVATAAAQMMERCGVPLAMIVIDTMMAAAGFRDANDAAEAQRVMKPLGDVAAEFGILVVSVDHFGKDQAAGTRNSSVKEDNADAVLALLVDRATGGEVKNARLAIRKCRGAAAGAEIPFSTRFVAVWGKTPSGGVEPTETLVIEWGSEKASSRAKSNGAARPLSRGLSIFMDSFRIAIARRERLERVPGSDSETRCASRESIREEFDRRYHAKNVKAKREQFRRCAREAVAKGLIESGDVSGKSVYWAATNIKPTP